MRSDHAGHVAAPAVLERTALGVELDLAAVRGTRVAVAEASVALEAARPRGAGRRGVRDREAGHAASTTVTDVGLGADAVVAAVHEPVRAARDAGTLVADLARGAGVATRAAVGAAGHDVRLAAVGAVTVAVAHPRVAGDDHASAGGAGGVRIREVAASTAGAAVEGVARDDIDAAVTAEHLTRGADSALAGARDAARHATRGGEAALAAATAVRGVVLGVHAARAADRAPARAGAGSRLAGLTRGADPAAGAAVVRIVRER